MNAKNTDLCPLCGGVKREGKTMFAAELGLGAVVIRDVPAMVCTQCRQDWITDEAASRIERTVQEARRKHSQVEVLSYS